jgi:hypothetical protein
MPPLASEELSGSLGSGTGLAVLRKGTGGGVGAGFGVGLLDWPCIKALALSAASHGDFATFLLFLNSCTDCEARLLNSLTSPVVNESESERVSAPGDQLTIRGTLCKSCAGVIALSGSLGSGTGLAVLRKGTGGGVGAGFGVELLELGVVSITSLELGVVSIT